MAAVGAGLVLYFCVLFSTCFANKPDLLTFPSQLDVTASENHYGCASHSENRCRQPDICSTLEGHLDVHLTTDIPVEDPWKQIKWTGPPATCPVKGHLIEKLEPALDFRRGFALRFVSWDVEDKTQMLPWMLGTRVNLNARKRRVLLNLGANAFSTSTTWFLRMYPCDFTEVHLFEADEELVMLPHVACFDEARNYVKPGSLPLVTKEVAGVPAWMLSRIHVYNQLASDRDDVATQAVNITRFMKEELQLKAEDAVVVKMDIEGSEWPILQRWVQDADMAAIVDELFVEIHYDHPTMAGLGWSRFAPYTREQAHTFLAQLRLHGFYVHPWP